VATLNTGSALYTFDSANAVDQGNYVGQYVQQKSLMVQLAGCPFTVFFRPDVDGSRDEVVVELGKMWSGTPAHVTTPYTFTVTKNGALLFTQTVPYHWWWARWRWQSAARPYVRTAASLMADGKSLLPYTTAYLYGYTPVTARYYYGGNIVHYVNPMDNGGLDPSEGDTGDRPELGPLTLAQSDYILLGTPAAQTAMIDQAETSASMSFHIRDENTGQWFDNQAHPYYGVNSGIPWAAAPSDPNYIILNGSHMPNLCYAPYLFTDDPYYLEEVQAAALVQIVGSSWFSQQESLPGLVYAGETRGIAWGTLKVAHAAYATPASVPSWLNSQAHWQTNLNDNYTWAQRFVNSPAKMMTVFHAFGPTQSVVQTTSGIEGFEMDYLAITYAWIARMFPSWNATYQWIMGGYIPQVTTSSGWLKGWPDPYGYDFWNVSYTPSSPTYHGQYIPDTSLDSYTVNTWAEAFSYYCSRKGNTNDPSLTNCPNPPWDGNSIVQTGGDSYYYWRSSALHLAVGLNVTGAAAASTWLDSAMAARFNADAGVGNWHGEPRWSFDTK
jgi:hypothetical protein